MKTSAQFRRMSEDIDRDLLQCWAMLVTAMPAALTLIYSLIKHFNP